MDRRTLAQRRSVLPQRPGASPLLHVVDVVLMGRTPWVRHAGIYVDVDHDVARQTMEELEITHLSERLYPDLSGGEAARVHLARVLAQDTPILLLDEPTAALDLTHQHRLLAIARRRAAAGASVAIVLHDLTLAAAYATRTVVLAAGRIDAEGPTAEVLDGDRLTRVYGHPVAAVRHPTQDWTFPVAERTI
jgi:iron complex transport system ATP-binding protein